MKFRNFQLFFVLIAISAGSIAQTTYSPYTLFGAGQIEQDGSGTNHAMGGTGIALRSYRTLNNINPASYCGIDSLSFIFDIGVFGKYTIFQKGSYEQGRYSGNFRYLAIGSRLYKWWGLSVGIKPYSSVDYEINSTDQVEGGLSTYYRNYNGKGGITQFYFGNAFTVYKNLSIGVNISYLLGKIEQLESIRAVEFPSYDIVKTNTVHNMMLDFGIQYSYTLNNLNYTIGAVYGPKRTLNAATDLYLINNYGDTIPMDHKNQSFIIPQKIGFGFAVEKKNKFRAGIDYEKRDWSDLKFNNPQLETRNSERFSLGMEYTPLSSIHDGWLKRCYYRIGANYNKSYLIIDKKPINSMALTVGVGMPLRRQLSTINLSFEMGQNGTTEKNLIKETYYLVHLNFSLHDYWFMKPKYD